MKLQDGTRVKLCKGHAGHVCDVLIPIRKSAPVRCDNCKVQRKQELNCLALKRKRERAKPKPRPADLKPSDAKIVSGVVSAVKSGWMKYQIRDEFGLTNKEITNIVCAHYQRPARIGERV